MSGPARAVARPAASAPAARRVRSAPAEPAPVARSARPGHDVTRLPVRPDRGSGMSARDPRAYPRQKKEKEYGYEFGDKYPGKDGEHKTGDAANFGIFKQNWGDLRRTEAMRRHVGQVLTADDWKEGARVNRSLPLDVAVLHEQQEWHTPDGLARWLASHRFGPSGLEAFDRFESGKPLSPEQRRLLASILTYRDAVMWILSRLVRDPELQVDDRKAWVLVPNV